MKPHLTHIDHIHVYVRSWEIAEQWYTRVLGFHRDEALASWATPGGPLTLQNESGDIHLALFEKPDAGGDSAVAFGADADTFLQWVRFLRSEQIELRIADHKLAFSMYFSDPDNNLHEITTYDHQPVRQELAS